MLRSFFTYTNMHSNYESEHYLGYSYICISTFNIPSMKNLFFQRKIITFGLNEVASKLLNKINCKCLEQDLVSACLIVSRGKNGTYVY